MKDINHNTRHNYFFALVGMLLLVVTLGCEREDKDLMPAPFPNTAEIFVNGFSAGLQYDAFGDSKVTAFTVDENVSFEDVIGTSSMRFDVPNEGDPEGSFAGGVFRDLGGRDLTGYDALTFYAQASKAATINLIGFGNDFLGDKYSATTSLKLSTSWNKYIIPIPDPSKLTMEKGMLVFAEAPEDGEAFSIWLDVVKFEKLGTLAHPRPAIMNGEDVTVNTYIGVTANLVGLTQTMNLPNGADQTVNAAPSYFEFNSSDTTVAKVSELGVVSVLSQGTAKITATLAGEDASGSLTIVSQGEFTHAPVPERDAVNVISIFSDAYTDVPVDFYNGFFQPFQKTLGGADLEIDGDQIIRYTQLNFVATEFKNPTVDASEMTHFHVDIQIENALQTGDFFTIELSDFGPDGAFGGGDDATGSVTYNTSPPLVSNEWISLDIPLSDFTGLTQQMNMAQILFKTDGSATDLPGSITDVLVDNMYFYKDGEGSTPIPPTSPADAPTEAAANVISIYSDAYTNVPNQGYNLYGAAAFEEVDLMGNKSLKYTFVAGENGNFQVIELGGGNQIDAEAAGMTNFRFDIWFPNAAGQSSAFLMKVVDIPSGGPTEGPINISPASTPEMKQGSWLSYDIPITELESNGLGGKSNIQQVVVDLLSSGEVYIDNIYFYKSGGGATEPTTAAPTPTQDAANVISVYSDAYTDIAGTNFNPGWGQATVVSEVQIEGNNTQLYTGLDFQGIELGSSQDVSGMEFLHLDYWTVSSTALNTFLISPGPAETAKALTVPTSGWTSVDIPLTDFTAVNLADVIQMKFDGNGDIYLDNIFFYKAAAGGNEPTDAPAAPPARDPADVISIYGEAYGAAVGLSNVPWDGATEFTEVNIASNNVLKVDFDGFLGTDLGSVTDASAMTHFHMDFWIADDFTAGQIFNPKWSNHAGGSGETSSFELTRAIGGDDTKKWVSIDVPITDFTTGDNTQRGALAQYLISVAGMIDVAYIDNIYFYKESGGGGPAAPTDAPPAPPARDEADVVSVYGEAYGTAIGLSNVGWDGATEFTEVNIASNNVLKVDFDGFMGSDLGSVADASAMTHFHMDFWISDDFSAGQIFNPKWSNHAGGSGETSSFELTRAIGGGDVQKWVSIDVPITDFTTGDNTQRGDLAQFLISVASLIDIAYIDNIYFYKDSGGGGGGGPSQAAPTPPTRDAANVVSIYSDAYTNISTDNFDAGWCGGAAVTGVTIGGSNTLKKNTGVDCHGIDFSTNRQDLSSFTHIHFDFYTNDTDLVGDVFNVKLVDFAGGAGEASALEVNINTGTVPAIEAGVWVSVDIDITSLGGVVAGSLTRSDIAQIGITTANLTNVWYDNIYLYK